MPPALVSAIGFRDDLVWQPLQHIHADHLVGIATPHRDSQACAKALKVLCHQHGVRLDVLTVGAAFDFLAWHAKWLEAIRLADGRPVVNMTAGHGMSTSAAAAACMETGATAIQYDDLEGVYYQYTPRALLHKDDLSAAEMRILRVVHEGPKSVSDIAAATKLTISGVSRALTRLRGQGFVHQHAEGLQRIHTLGPGVEELLGLEVPSA